MENLGIILGAGSLLILLGLILAGFVYSGFAFYRILKLISANLEKITDFAVFFATNGPKLVKFSEELHGILDGGNQINEDAVQINTKMLQEYARMRELLGSMQSMMFPMEQIEEPLTPSKIKADYQQIYGELLQAGYDETEAKLIAGGRELDEIYENGVDSNFAVGE